MPARSLVALTLLASFAMTTSAQTDLAPIRAWREAHGARILRDFVKLLEIPNVASDTENIRRNAEHIAVEFGKRGARMEIWELEGAPPLVFGELEAEEATRTLGVYFHYDGQPVDVSQWSQPPWQPTLYSRAIEDGGTVIPFPEPGAPIDPEWRLYGRSTGDDKAPYAAILGALDALAAAGVTRTSNLKLFFEGEEEAGSDHLGAYMEKYRDRLDVDLWLICDGPVHQSRTPQVVFGVRGYTGFDLTVYGASRYLHSGHYGNWAPNPAMMLAQLLASMKDDAGNVVIEGFHDSTAPVGQAERDAIAVLPDFDDALRRELGLAATEGGNAPLAERILMPSLNVRGMVSAAVGDAARNVIPTTATASVDVRLVKGNDPQGMLDVVERHLRKQGYHVVDEAPDEATRLAHPKLVRFVRRPGYPAARTEMGEALVQSLIAAADKAADGDLILMPTMGGSLPLYLFTDELAEPVVIVPIANHDDNQHAPDENLRLANLWYGIDLMASLFTME
jgi:acetylornithine deacetylase/succinyl-diaminopimelate desuccinylase-like protein